MDSSYIETHLEITYIYWNQLIADAKPGFQTRFANNFSLYLLAIKQEVKDRTSGEIPSLEIYIKHRQLSTGCKPLFDLIEYSLKMELPDYVIQDPILEAVQGHVNDFLAQDIFSYNIEQSRGVTQHYRRHYEELRLGSSRRCRSRREDGFWSHRKLLRVQEQAPIV